MPRHHIQKTQRFKVNTATKGKFWDMARMSDGGRYRRGSTYRDCYQDVIYDVLWWHDHGNKPPQRGWKFQIKHYGYRDGRPYLKRRDAMRAALETIDNGKNSSNGLQEYLDERISDNLGERISPF